MRDSNRTYKGIRRLAINDVKRRMSALSHLGLKWEIISGDMGDGVIGYRAHYSLKDLDQEFTKNEYAMIREIKYIVWRFELLEKDLWGDKNGY